MGQIEDLLRMLGITKKYKGYRRISFILRLALDEEDRLEAITKELYMEAASELNCNWEAVEHSIRTVIKRAWKINPALMQEIAGYSMYSYPENSEFFSIAVGYIQRHTSLSEQAQ